MVDKCKRDPCRDILRTVLIAVCLYGVFACSGKDVGTSCKGVEPIDLAALVFADLESASDNGLLELSRTFTIAQPAEGLVIGEIQLVNPAQAGDESLLFNIRLEDSGGESGPVRSFSPDFFRPLCNEDGQLGQDIFENTYFCSALGYARLPRGGGAELQLGVDLQTSAASHLRSMFAPRRVKLSPDQATDFEGGVLAGVNAMLRFAAKIRWHTKEYGR